MKKIKKIKRLRNKSDERDTSPERLRGIFSRSVGIVSREMFFLAKASRRAKLNPMQAAELRQYVMLLSGVIRQQREIQKSEEDEKAKKLSEMSDEDFEKKVKELLKKPKVKNEKTPLF